MCLRERCICGYTSKVTPVEVHGWRVYLCTPTDATVEGNPQMHLTQRVYPLQFARYVLLPFAVPKGILAGLLEGHRESSAEVPINIETIRVANNTANSNMEKWSDKMVKARALRRQRWAALSSRVGCNQRAMCSTIQYVEAHEEIHSAHPLSA
jgi:hypothetical protein